MATKFETLSGLPSYGPMALPFPPDGTRSFKEGLVVKFEPENEASWIGNFQRGVVSLDRALIHPDGQQVIVIAGGAGYVVDPDKQCMTRKFGRDEISHVEVVHDPEIVVTCGFTDFDGFLADGTAWTSPRISWDGIKNISIDGVELKGEAYSPLDDKWHPFMLDLLTGKCEDSIYEEQIKHFVEVKKS